MWLVAAGHLLRYAPEQVCAAPERAAFVLAKTLGRARAAGPSAASSAGHEAAFVRRSPRDPDAPQDHMFGPQGPTSSAGTYRRSGDLPGADKARICRRRHHRLSSGTLESGRLDHITAESGLSPTIDQQVLHRRRPRRPIQRSLGLTAETGSPRRPALRRSPASARPRANGGGGAGVAALPGHAQHGTAPTEERWRREVRPRTEDGPAAADYLVATAAPTHPGRESSEVSADKDADDCSVEVSFHDCGAESWRLALDESYIANEARKGRVEVSSVEIER